MQPVLWYDWPFIIRHRRRFRSLDNILSLTRGAPLDLAHLFSSIGPSDRLFTGVYDPGGGSDKVIGQVYQSPHMSSAHFDYLLLTEGTGPSDVIPLLEGLIEKVGLWGGKQVVADLLIESDLFPQFRQAGFFVVAKQRIYRYENNENQHKQSDGRWRSWSRDDISAMRRLYQNVVPPLIQPVEPLSRHEMVGLVYYDESNALQAYADLVYGPKGVWILPIFHPQTEVDMADMLLQLVGALPELNGRPVYMAARSYLPWVEQALGQISAEPGPEQAILVRYLALYQRVEADFGLTSLENGKPEPTVPLAPISNHYEG